MVQLPTLKNPAAIKNKLKRQEVFARQKQLKNIIKRKTRARRAKAEAEDPSLKEKRLAENIPKTLENTREFDETVVDIEDEEVINDEQCDEFSSYFEQGKVPKILITTSQRPSRTAYEFADELVSIFPNAEFVKRQPLYDLKKIVEFSNNRDYTDIMVVNEDSKTVNALTLIHLPDGPTAHFKLTNIIHSKDIHNHGRATAHQPELILNNFSTRLGHTIGRMFASLFPHVPEFQGRQVATLHNQRDFIFFRRHRYIFKNDKKANLQEIGPRFTLKLQWLQKGTFDTKGGDFEWLRKSELETSRRRFFL